MNKGQVTIMIFVSIILDAQEFTEPRFGRNQDLRANRSRYIDCRFVFEAPDTNRIGSITCGFPSDVVVQKQRSRPAVVYPKYAGKAEIVSDLTGKSLTFRFKNLALKDAKDGLSCLLTYLGLPYESGKYNLKVYGKFYSW